ncbi:MAG: hypothetical protein ABR587_16430 [Candidatus Binatia bacterium]
MFISRLSGAALLALSLSFGVIACEKEKGPAEKIGAKMDEAAGDIKAAAKEAKEDIEDAADEAEDEIKH